VAGTTAREADWQSGRSRAPAGGQQAIALQQPIGEGAEPPSKVAGTGAGRRRAGRREGGWCMRRRHNLLGRSAWRWAATLPVRVLGCCVWAEKNQP
jgi:hypothetical protein